MVKDFLELEGLECFDSNDRVTESYPLLFMREDIAKDKRGHILNFTSFDGIAYQESQGSFVPSIALTCAAVKRFYELKSSSSIAKRVLDMYKDKGDGNGRHGQNTLVDYRTNNSGQIIHYPHNSDFPSGGDSIEINSLRRRIALPFNSSDFSDCLLKDALKLSNFADYIKNLTGLQDPEFLIELGKYFDKPTKVWTWWDIDKVSSAWFGCYNILDLNGGSNLYISYASRGVRFGAEGSAKKLKEATLTEIITLARSELSGDALVRFNERLKGYKIK